MPRCALAASVRASAVLLVVGWSLSGVLVAQVPTQTALNTINDEIGQAYRELMAASPTTRDEVESRIAVLRVTRAYLELLAATRGQLEFTVNGKPYDAAAAKSQIPALERELERLDAQIGASEKAARREGAEGELGRLTAAALRHTRALVQQRLVMARFGVPPYVTIELPAVPAEHAPLTAAANQPGEPAPMPSSFWRRGPSPTALHVTSSYRLTEGNRTFVRYSWQAFVQSYESEGPIEFDLVIDYKDNDGYILYSDTRHRQAIAALGGRPFEGYNLIQTEVAQRVVSVEIRTDDLRYVE